MEFVQVVNIKDVCYKLLRYWAYCHTWRGGSTYGRSMTFCYKTKISRSDGLP